MTQKLRKLTDFQLIASASGLGDSQRSVNHALFATFEPIRLWLKDREIVAPFRKLAISFADAKTAAPWHGHVTVAGEVCEVTWGVGVEELRSHAVDHRWVIDHVIQALGAVKEKKAWSSPDLMEELESLAKTDMPLVHFFRSLRQVDPDTGIECVPWMSTRPGETRVGVRLFEQGRTRDVEIAAMLGPLFLEDSFPMARTAIRGREFLILDGRRKAIARIPLRAN